MKNNKFYTVRTDPTFNQIIVEKGKFNPTNAHIQDRSLDLLSTGSSKMWQGGTTNAHIHHRSLDWFSTGTSKMWQGGTSFLGIKIIFCTHMYLFDDINSYMTNFQLSLKL
jgi:hypothetical protein